MKKLIAIIIGIVLVFVLSTLLFDWGRKGESTREENKDVINSIEVFSPLDGEEITSPILISGKARGYWFFEASFPVKLFNYDGELISTSYVTAQSDWMTTDFVDFSGEIIFPSTTTGRALILLENDNPSGDPENSIQRYIQVILK